jgi:hypothetical protein
MSARTAGDSRLVEMVDSPMSRFWIVPSAMSLLVVSLAAEAVPPPTASAVMAHAATHGSSLP